MRSKFKSNSDVTLLKMLFSKVALVGVFLILLLASVYTYTRMYGEGVANAATSSNLNFQARLLNSSGSVVSDGYYNIEFKLYDGGTAGGPAGVGQPNAGSLLWTETRTGSDKVRVVNGYFSANLGSVTAFPSINWDQELWLTMNVGGSGAPAFDGEMNPRLKLTSTPYAFVAGQLRKTVGANSSILDFLTPTANRTINLPDASGTVLLDSTGFANNGNSFGGSATLGTNDTNDLILETGGLEGLRLDQSGGVSIGTNADALEKLEVNGGIKLGNSTGTNAGTLRWTGTDFEGYNGSQWVSLTIGNEGTATGSFVSGLANVGANVTGTPVETLIFTTATAVSNVAGVTGFTAPADGSFTTCLIKNNANVTAGTLNLRWRVNGASVGAAACPMNSTTNRQSASAISNGVVTFSAGDTIGIAFDTVGMAPTTNDFTVYWTVEYKTGGGSQVASFTQGGNAFGTPAILGTTDNQALSVITNGNQALNITNAGQAQFQFGVSVANILQVLSGGASINGGIDNNSGGVTNVGTLSGVTSLTASGALSVATATDSINGLVINAGSLSSISGFSQTYGNFDFNNNAGNFSVNSSGLDISSAGALSGITTINTSSDITSGGNVFSNAFDRSAAGALTLGGLNATSIAICESANCDSITIGTNADADTIQIGDASDTVTITGGSGSTIVWNGFTIDATELNRLDAKDAALVDLNDFISGDGAGVTSSGSGLESGTGGIGLLQGCANNEGLVWNDTTSVWGCSLANLDTSYNNDSDKTMTVSDVAGLTYNLTSTGGLFVADAGITFASFTNTGGITFAPLSTSDVSLNLDDDSNFLVSGAITNDGQLTDISVTLGNDANADTVSGLRINATSAATGDADTLLGILIANLNAADATVTETALQFGTGWDNAISFQDANTNIRLGATDNTGILTITDNAATPNTLVRLEDHATNFGASLEAGAFIDYNSMYQDEFFKDRAQVAADGNQNWGDNTEWNTNETGTCTWDGTADAINGITSMVANAIGTSCTLQHSDLGAATPNTWIDANNLPTFVMKVRPSVAGAGVPDTNHQFFAGAYDGAFGAAPASGAPVNGIYFSNASDAAGVTGTANWYAVTDNGAAVTNTPCGVAVSETGYALLIIKVMSPTLVKFYIDNDVSNGVNLVECGTGNTANINTAGMTPFLKADFDAVANASTLDVDFYRVWQDDAAPQSPEEVAASSNPTEEAVNAADQSDPLMLDNVSANVSSRSILSDLMLASEDLQNNSSNKLDTGLVIASEGVISPQVTSDRLMTNSIEAASGADVSLKLDQAGAFVVSGNNSEELARIDGLGNASFAGNLTVNSLNVASLQLGGVDYMQPIDELKTRITLLENRPNTLTSNGQLDLSNIQLGALTVIGEATFKEAVRFEKDVQFNSQINILGYTNVQGLTVNLDLITKGSLVVEGKATFKEAVRFEKDVQFAANVEVKGEFTTNKDTSGISKITSGETKVKVEFTKPKTSKPIITLSLGNGKFVQYSYQNVTETGFEIILATPASEDLEFSWIALQASQEVVMAP